MDLLLQQLSGILVNALPTAFLVIVLSVYLKFVLFKPLDKVLAERYALTDGARKAAEESSKSAGAKVSEYEAKLNAARGEIYKEQEEFLRQIHTEQAEQVKAARKESDARVAEAKAAIAAEAAAAKLSLDAQSDALATQIADSILNRRVA